MADIARQLQEQVIQARENGQRLDIVAGGTKQFMGRATNSTNATLEVRGHCGIVDYQPAELVLTARAGTTLDDIEAALAEHGQTLHCEPPRIGSASTLGGTLACNLSGPARPWNGSLRDQVLGLRLINGRGQHLRFGGQVMKNVAGYDVSRLQAGALGTLGVITEVSIKVMPKPAASLTLVQEMSMEEAIPFMNRRAAEPKPLSAACWWNDKVYLRLAGARSAVEATGRGWPGRTLESDGEFWRQLRDLQHDFFQAGEAPLWRFSTGPCAAAPELEGQWLLNWAGAERWFRGPGELREMEAPARAAGGQVSLLRGGNRHGEVMHNPPAAIKELQRRIKEAFDPAGIFNPGRLYGWL